MILCYKLKNGLCKIVTTSQVVTKFNVTKSRLHCTVLLLKGFNPIVSTINTWYIVVARAINDAVGAP